MKYNSTRTLDLTDPSYLELKNEQVVAIEAGVTALFVKDKIDAIVDPTSPRPATPINPPTPLPPGARYGFDFEQATKAIVRPNHRPPSPAARSLSETHGGAPKGYG